jgi:hypothetical protein
MYNLQYRIKAKLKDKLLAWLEDLPWSSVRLLLYCLGSLSFFFLALSLYRLF